VRRRHLRAIRRDRAKANNTPEQYSSQTTSETIQREEIDAALTALAGLPERQRRALELVYQEGLTHDEAAAVLGWSRGAGRGVCHSWPGTY
jgi:RNA polymerase sigma factor (sigma-70 family)